ncbi:MAG: hypothetical protein IIB00_09670 [candidate division Zixibacteria bacterium]|nr:hypothetical protein [candidate division Zixibacteria bacterium]
MNRRRKSTVSANDTRQVMFITLVAAVVPLLFFPGNLGITFTVGAVALFLTEVLYYMAVVFAFNSSSGLQVAFVGAAVTFLYRLALGAVFGLMVFALGGLSLDESLTMGLTSYLPAVLLHSLAAPFVMLGVVKTLIEKLEGDQDFIVRPDLTGAVSPVNNFTSSQPGRPTPEMAQGLGAESPSTMAPRVDFERTTDLSALEGEPRTESLLHDRINANGFERAVNYLGEMAPVLIAAVTDREGLELASFTRRGFTSWSWSPLTMGLIEENINIFSRHGRSALDGVKLDFEDVRIVARRIGNFDLLIVAERHEEDLLGLRVNQACEMIEKYVSNRYDNKLFVNTEESDVRSA